PMDSDDPAARFRRSRAPSHRGVPARSRLRGPAPVGSWPRGLRGGRLRAGRASFPGGRREIPGHGIGRGGAVLGGRLPLQGDERSLGAWRNSSRVLAALSGHVLGQEGFGLGQSELNQETKMAKWFFEPGHTAAEFCARHMMVSCVRGHFKDVHGTLDFDPKNPQATSVEATIDARGLWSGEPDRDVHLKSADFLDVENHPTIAFRGKGLDLMSATEGTMKGDLTI